LFCLFRADERPRGAGGSRGIDASGITDKYSLVGNPHPAAARCTCKARYLHTNRFAASSFRAGPRSLHQLANQACNSFWSGLTFSASARVKFSFMDAMAHENTLISHLNTQQTSHKHAASAQHAAARCRQKSQRQMLPPKLQNNFCIISEHAFHESCGRKSSAHLISLPSLARSAAVVRRARLLTREVGLRCPMGYPEAQHHI
jgi:hypothetical protein